MTCFAARRSRARLKIERRESSRTEFILIEFSIQERERERESRICALIIFTESISLFTCAALLHADSRRYDIKPDMCWAYQSTLGEACSSGDINLSAIRTKCRQRCGRVGFKPPTKAKGRTMKYIMEVSCLHCRLIKYCVASLVTVYKPISKLINAIIIIKYFNIFD